MVFRRVYIFFLWTTNRFKISTTVTDGNWEPGRPLCGIGSRFRQEFSTTTVQGGVYAFIFDQKKLMGGIGIQGSKITQITPD